MCSRHLEQDGVSGNTNYGVEKARGQGQKGNGRDGVDPVIRLWEGFGIVERCQRYKRKTVFKKMIKLCQLFTNSH